jgi:hypothetical protein
MRGLERKEKTPIWRLAFPGMTDKITRKIWYGWCHFLSRKIRLMKRRHVESRSLGSDGEARDEFSRSCMEMTARSGSEGA